MHKVAEASTFAGAFLVLAALGLTEVCHRRVLGHDHATAVVAPVHTFHGRFCLDLVCKLDVNVAYHVVTDIVCDDHLLHLAKLGHFHEDFLVEALKMLDCLYEVLLGHVPPVRKSNRSVRVLVHVREAHCLAQGRLVVDASACVPMPARSYFEVERTIYSKANKVINLVKRGIVKKITRITS